MARVMKDKNLDALITYEEYKSYSSNPVDESAFEGLRRKATLKLHYFTDYRLKQLEVIPEEVKLTLAEFIDIINLNEQQIQERGIANLTSYSNGIESLGFQGSDSSNPDKSVNALLRSRMVENLAAYPNLFFRGNLLKDKVI